ncbi:hypothetical protein CKO50_19225 [Pseudoalteromonas sp. HM-SA03]|uniref:response regulator transcription factor n=1 Tax=Pseudoalteromonas sp. HM-SA03 TaxID=2029678 RepID=UPI000BAE04C6|nr:response regulator transcription factor [Pseudoalteromonas sp. HM-SA03]PAX99844.1 hypothetical protein CKO50_19225 [Pseudoalteromonas sp. HM-SA03]
MLADLIKQNGITKACIVDDANDNVPVLNDLTNLSHEWNNLLDDIPLNNELVLAISEGKKGFDIDSFSADDADDEFVKILWSLRTKFPTELSELFNAYESTKLADSRYVQTLKDILEESGFEVTTAGRDFNLAVEEADIIFIDLFLHLDQTEDNLKYSINILKDIVRKRIDNPPIIVLISRSNRLLEHGRRFRDECGLIESGFRIYKKVDLEDKNKLIFCIKKLLEHYKDSIKVLRFLNAWERHATNAVSETVSSLKKLDLLDHNMVHNLLLDEEGQSSSSYFMDLFDSVLLHNFESQADIVNSAQELNQIDFSLTPTIQGLQKAPLQELVFKSIFMGSERCKLNDKDSIELGDIYKLASAKSDENDFLQLETESDNVWLVITPSCDLMRTGIKNIGLLKGTLSKVSYDNWSSDTKSNTPVIYVDSDFYSIRWDIKSFMTYPKTHLKKLLNNDVFYRTAKMREVNALGLQQSFTADYSRVGQRAILPPVFKVSIQLAYLDSEMKLNIFSNQEASQGLCYVGPKKQKIVNFSHRDYENVLASLRSLNLECVHPLAKSNVQNIIENPYSLIEAIDSGVEVGNKYKNISTGGNVLAKILFGEPNEQELKALKGTGFVFIVESSA